jgi:hypothetical protein
MYCTLSPLVCIRHKQILDLAVDQGDFVFSVHDRRDVWRLRGGLVTIAKGLREYHVICFGSHLVPD